MTELEFAGLWNRLHLVLGYAAPKDERKTLCAQLVRDRIPGEAVPFIKRAVDQLDQKPRNISGWFLAQWGRWQDAHPHRMTRAQERPAFDCPECWGSGYFYADKMAPDGHSLQGGVYTEVFRCAHCQQVQCDTLPCVTRSWLLEQGYTIQRPPRSKDDLSPGGTKWHENLERIRYRNGADAFRRGGDFYDMVKADNRAAKAKE